MTTANVCKEQACSETIPGGHYLCRRHWQEEQDKVINECPQCGVYKNASYELCRGCDSRAQVETGTTPNTCKAQFCRRYVQRTWVLCREHWRDSQDGVINECPQCRGVYKNAKFDVCLDCFEDGKENRRANGGQQGAPTGDSVRADTFADRIAFIEEDRKAQDKRLLFDYQQGKCVYCGNGLGYDELEIEHMVPKSRGGQDNIRNYQLACSVCNQAKGTMTDIEFRMNHARHLPQQERVSANPPIKPELLNGPGQNRPSQRFHRR